MILTFTPWYLKVFFHAALVFFVLLFRKRHYFSYKRLWSSFLPQIKAAVTRLRWNLFSIHTFFFWSRILFFNDVRSLFFFVVAILGIYIGFRVFFTLSLNAAVYASPASLFFVSTQPMPGTYIGVEGKCKPPMNGLCSCVTGSSVSPTIPSNRLALHGIVSSCSPVYGIHYY